MLLVLVVALLAAAGMAGAWYGRLQERAWWTRRLLERGLNPNTLYPRQAETAVEPLAPEHDAMREAMEEMQREVSQLAEGQRFLTQLLAERRALPPERAGSPPPHDPHGPGDERGSPADRRS
jgi:hypothetical protein